MIAFGLAEVATGLTHNFFGISTSDVTAEAYAGAAIGLLYAAAGLLILSMKRRAAAIAIMLLVADILGRIAMIVAGLYPIDSLKQRAAIVLGTSIVAVFAIYIRLKWSSFR
jgi:Co/Zn/Cd efflux system component